MHLHDQEFSRSATLVAVARRQVRSDLLLFRVVEVSSAPLEGQGGRGSALSASRGKEGVGVRAQRLWSLPPPEVGVSALPLSARPWEEVRSGPLPPFPPEGVRAWG
jgi:hypothetical protein